MLKFVLLCGLPGVGKSYRVAEIRKELNNVIVLSTDDYIEYLCAKEGITYDEGFKAYFPQAKKHMKNQFQYALDNNMNIVLDQTNLSVKSRASKLAEIPVSKNYSKIAEVFVVRNQNLWMTQLASRPGKTIPHNVIAMMQKNFVLPSFDEGFDTIIWRKV